MHLVVSGCDCRVVSHLMCCGSHFVQEVPCFGEVPELVVSLEVQRRSLEIGAPSRGLDYSIGYSIDGVDPSLDGLQS